MAISPSANLPTPSPVQPARRGRRWFLRGGLLAVALGLSMVAWLEWRRLEVRRAAEEALQLAQQVSFSDAEPKLRAALERDPDNSELLRALVIGLFGTEKYAEAEAALTHWCQIRPDDAEPYRLRMDLRHRILKFEPGTARQRVEETAVADGLRVIELDPDDDATARKVIWICLGSGRFQEADRVCRRYLERQPDDSELLFLQARVCHARGKIGEAQGLLDKLLSRLPQFTSGLLLRAILHYEANEAERAIPLLRRVISEGGGLHKEARYHLGLALARAGHTEEAQRVMAEVQRENFEKDTARPGEADNLAVRVRRAELLFSSGRGAEALASLQAVLAEAPKYAAAHHLLATYYDQQGEKALAAEHRRRAGK